MRPVFPTADTARLELRLLGVDGEPWVVTFSPGTEQFIGSYPRLTGIEADGPLLVFNLAV
jgi:hypothetical protein